MVAVLFFVAIVIVSIYYIFKPITAEGFVDHKGVTGEKGDVSYTILFVTDSGIIIKDEDYRGLFASFTQVDESLENELKSEYAVIRYLVSIRRGDETMAYFVSRDDFNKVDVGDVVRYEIFRFKETKIRILKVIQKM